MDRAHRVRSAFTAFDRVSHGATEMMLVTGYAGSGKSSLVNEIHTPITEKRGYFISGKFDQFKRNIPYSGLIQAFQGLMRHLLTEAENQIAQWKERLLEALGPNGQVMIDVIPDVELIIGKQPAVPDLPPHQAQNRFNFVFQNFVRTCAAADHPLVIFLDDLQWADWASLTLLEFFMIDPITRCMLIVGAYRDNEVSDAHPLMLTLNNIQKARAVVNTITLTPLALEHVTHLIADTLNSQTQVCTPLAELSLRKTGGNPFFLRQFLQALYEDGLVEFDVNQDAWAWEFEKIRKREITDNVVELMAGKIRRLPEKNQYILKLAACIGNQFDLHMLSIVHEKSPTDTMHELWEALQEELIVPLDDTYKYVGRSENGKHQTPNTNFKFLHDRVQQATYSLIEEEHKHDVHLKIGRLLLSNTSEEEREEHILDIVNHLNRGKDLVTDQSEKDELAQLNLIAGRKAKASAAYQAAFAYLQAGISLLDAESWQRQYKLTLALYVEATEAAFLIGDFEAIERWAEIVQKRANTLLDTVKIYEFKIQAYFAQNKLQDAVKLGLHLLKLLGVNFPEHPTKFHVVLGLLRTKFALTGKQVEDFANLPPMTDPDKLAAMRVLISMLTSAYMGAPELVLLVAFSMVNLSVKYGNASESAEGYAGYGAILCGVTGDIESGYRFGKLALRLLEFSGTQEFEAKTRFTVSQSIQHWKEHARETLQPFLNAYQKGLETGEFEFAIYSACDNILFSLYTGTTTVFELERKIAAFSDSLGQFRQETPLHFLELYWQALLNLGGKAENPCRLIGERYDEEKMLPLHREANARTVLCYLFFYKLFLCYLFQKYSQAVENATLAETYSDGAIAQFVIPLIHFYDSLSRLALYPDVSRSEQTRIIKKVAANQKKIKKWAFHAPMNHLHKWYLVEAERARVLGKDVEATEYYDKAIAGAKEYEYLNEEALAHESAAKFYLANNKRLIARAYMREAQYCYLKWGANAKVRHLDEQYPELLADTEETRRGERGVHLTQSSTSTETSSTVLDLATLMKASQTISGEIVLENLLKKMIRLVIENAGAQKGFLLLEKHGVWCIEAECQMACAEPPVLHSIPVDAASSVLSGAIVQYVTRTRAPVVLHDAAKEGQFTHDPYIIAHHPTSLLCVPLLNQGQLRGILYLENNLTAGAFTPERAEVLNLLSSQMAIAIENAQLYRNIEETLQRQVELTNAYERFVPHDFLSFLDKDSIMEVHLGDHVSKEMAVMFSDIRSFTRLSETMTPQENFDFINAYFKRVSPVVRAHDGCIVKFLGDGMMAVFPNGAEDAVRAGIAKLNTVAQYNRQRRQEGRQPIQVGIGVHVGHMMVGMVGDAGRMQGDAFSDNVNLTARLEGLTKYYGVSFLVTAATVKALPQPDRYHLRFLGKVQVHGKQRAISIYEIYDSDPDDIIAMKIRTGPDFERGLFLYYARGFVEAAMYFKHVLSIHPDDTPAALYLKRAAHFMVEGVPDDWNGAEILEHK